MRITSCLSTALTPTVVALGNFDGVHLGHQQVIKPILGDYVSSQLPLDVASHFHVPQAVSFASWHGIAVSAGQNDSVLEQDSAGKQKGKENVAGEFSYPTVVTFHPHPQEFLTGQPKKLLTPLNEKVLQIRSLGVEQLVLLPFDRELAVLSPEQFVANILMKKLRASQISVGEDFHFGQGRIGNAEDLRAIAARFGVKVHIVPLQTCQGERISSSAIRQALQRGNLQTANLLLGEPYRLIGTVVPGQQLGRTLGFPTANLQLPAEKFIPRWGVYAVRVFVSDGDGDPTAQLGVMNIGCRPTVSNTEPTVEVHLLDWSGDLYGKTLLVYLEQFLRPEQKFASIELLKSQIHADCLLAKQKL